MSKSDLTIQEAYVLIDWHLAKAREDKDLAVKQERMDRIKHLITFIESMRDK